MKLENAYVAHWAKNEEKKLSKKKFSSDFIRALYVIWWTSVLVFENNQNFKAKISKRRLCLQRGLVYIRQSARAQFFMGTKELVLRTG